MVPHEILRELILGVRPSLGRAETAIEWTQAGERINDAEIQRRRKICKSLRSVVQLREARKITSCEQKLARSRRIESVCLDDLSLPPGLTETCVEH